MQSIRTFTHYLSLAALSFGLLLSACSPAAVETAAPSPPSAPEPSSPAVAQAAAPTATAPGTPTSAPTITQTAEPAATATAVPTETPTTAPTFGPAEDGLSAWCLPDGAAVSQASDPANPPANARFGEFVAGALEIRNLPSSACVVIYNFNQPAPEGLVLEIYEIGQPAPFWTENLPPVVSSPNTAAALLRHSYVIEPPVWEISFEFAVRDGQGAELRRDQVNLHRWTPALCWNGRRPNPITLTCPLPQDLHPWDAGYGTPIPTFPPEDE